MAAAPVVKGAAEGSSTVSTVATMTTGAPVVKGAAEGGSIASTAATMTGAPVVKDAAEWGSTSSTAATITADEFVAILLRVVELEEVLGDVAARPLVAAPAAEHFFIGDAEDYDGGVDDEEGVDDQRVLLVVGACGLRVVPVCTADLGLGGLPHCTSFEFQS